MHDVHEDFESSPDAYQVKLDAFEGPLDLLLYLIRKNEVNIYDIPISLITEQYLSYIELMQELNLDVAGEFLVMAATLIHIKSRTLLPRPSRRTRTTAPRRIRARRWCAGCSSTRSTRPPPSCCTSARRCAARSSCGPTSAWRRRPARTTSRSSKSISSACWRRSAACWSAPSRRPRMVLPPEQISIEDRMTQLLAAAVGDRGLRLRGAVRRRRRLAAVHDRHVPGAARDDPAEADSRVPVGGRRARFASTSARGRPTRRIRLAIRRLS